jgi:hypothetical protein
LIIFPQRFALGKNYINITKKQLFLLLAPHPPNHNPRGYDGGGVLNFKVKLFFYQTKFALNIASN